MSRPRLGAPFHVVLPSGTRVEVLARPSEAADLAQALELGALKIVAEGRAVDAYRLPLADANVLETIGATLGAVTPPRAKLTCRNCGEHAEVDAAAALPLGPLLEPPGDPELDLAIHRESARSHWHAFEAPVEVGRKGSCGAFRLAPRTLRDRLRLEELLGDESPASAPAPLPLGPPLVRALGLDAVGDSQHPEAPRVESAIAIARALEALDDAAFDRAWDAITRAYDEQHWPPRLLSPVACPSCGARHDVEVVRRPLAFAPPRGAAPTEEFPSLDAFTAAADELTRAVLGDRDYGGLVVVVEDGVPPCDDGGEPLLGSYTPEVSPVAGQVQGAPFVIALYYRTFRSMWDDEPYDVRAEIRETIEHELEHHQGFLDGHDPLDDDERAAIAEERRRLHGLKPGQELGASASFLAADFGRFLRVTWPLWLIVLVVTLLSLAGDR